MFTQLQVMLLSAQALNKPRVTISYKSCFNCVRRLSSTPVSFSGHSKWSTIKHDKAKKDNSKGKERATLSKEISDASKYGGADPKFNPRLVNALAAAKKAGFPKASIESAVARGQGRSTSGATLESLVIEAVVPPVALIVECQTDSKARALTEIRLILKNHGATTTPTAYLFEKRGRIVFQPKEEVGMDEVLEMALEHGAVDVFEGGDGSVTVDTEAAMLKPIEKAIAEAFSLEIRSSETVWNPNEDTKVTSIDAEAFANLAELREELQDYSGVQGVYVNLSLEEPN